jgi:tetratricopeptide (TPR) repeat protein
MKFIRIVTTIIVIIALSANNTIGQQVNRDSINQLIAKLPEIERPGTLLKIAGEISNTDANLAEEYIKQAIIFYIKRNDLKGMAKAYSSFGDLHSGSGRNDKALEFYQKALNLEIKNKNAGQQAYNLNSIGFIYYDKNDIEKAIEYFNKALSVAKSKSAIDEANALNSLGSAFRRKGDNVKAKEYFIHALSILKETTEKKTLAKTYQNIGLVEFEGGEYESAIRNYSLSETLRIEIKDIKGQGIIANNIGNVYFSWGKYENAITYYQKALKIFETLNFRNGIVSCYANIGNIYIKMKNLVAAKDYLEKALNENITLGRKKETASTYIQLINLHSKIINEKYIKEFGANWEREITKHKKSDSILAEYQICLDYNQKALQISKEINDQQQIATSLNNFGTIYSISGNLEKALEYYKGSLELNRKIGNKSEECVNLLAIGIVYDLMNKQTKAIKFLEEALQIAQKLQKKDTEMEIFRNLSLVYENKGNLAKSLETFKIFSNLKDTLLNKDNMKQIAELQTIYETDNKKKEIALLSKDKKLQETQIKQQQMAILFFVALTIAIAFLIFSLVRQNIQRKRNNKELAEKNYLITEQKKEITDSIHYAKRIQVAILPPIETVSEYLPEHFIFYKPRDIVSGDFYYISERDKNVIVVTADCTGHGVPGAFMSMLGSAFLHEIVNKTQELKADVILNDLRAQLIRALHQTGKTGESRDGMDLTLYILDRNSNKMQYAGANNPLIIVRDGELVEYKADKMPIGIHDRLSQPFTCNHIDLQKNDMLYTYSDGYVDQFGGEEGKKFMSKRFKIMLSEIGHLGISEQYKIIESSLQTWMHDYAQVDDILVIGVRV